MKKLARVGSAIGKLLEVNFPFLFIAVTAASASAANYYLSRLGYGDPHFPFALFLGLLFFALTICVLRHLREEEEEVDEREYYTPAMMFGILGWGFGLLLFSAFIYYEFRTVLNVGLSVLFTICVTAVIVLATGTGIRVIKNQLESLSPEERRAELWSMWRSALVLFTLFMLIPYL